ncbi:hypothetical protein BVC80_1481g15 [Macleaya cordata]|uniref:Zinc finger protein n=1 Tax=Macleaya cordata TaxID=56857 RepID=A0A200QNN2_MACCD|nr:hypothetical protein BVC80_1481g15 [Macleaya cordata]
MGRSSNESNYYKCQHSTCPGFQWLDDAKGEAKGYAGSSSNIDPTSTTCFACGLDDHWVKQYPWKETPSPRPNCTGTRKIRTSKTDHSSGKKFLTCFRCNKFHWLNDWIEKGGSQKMLTRVKVMIFL